MKKLILISLMLLLFTNISYTKTDELKRERVVKEKTTSSYRSFVVTWYCLRGRTFSGKPVSRHTAASDLKIFPLGTIIYVEGFGQYIVRDTGSAIRGSRLDLWTASCSEARRLGRKTLKVRRI